MGKYYELILSAADAEVLAQVLAEIAARRSDQPRRRGSCAPIALHTVVDAGRQFIAAAHGLRVNPTGRRETLGTPRGSASPSAMCHPCSRPHARTPRSSLTGR